MGFRTLAISFVFLVTLRFDTMIDAFSFRARKAFRMPTAAISETAALLPTFINTSRGHSHPYPANISRTAIAASSSSSSSIESNGGVASWKQRLLKFSNIASFLCVLDCTILPAVTLLLPLLGFVTSAATSELLCTVGHAAALYFVLPVGFLATTTNYLYNHRKFWITSIGWFGMLLIFGANAPHGHGVAAHAHHHAHAHAQGATRMFQTMRHTIQHGVAHRVTNLVGCGLLILSNRISHRQQDCCSHGGGHHSHHDHSHGDHHHAP